jgi:PBSX family phage terminase large subunit
MNVLTELAPYLTPQESAELTLLASLSNSTTATGAGEVDPLIRPYIPHDKQRTFHEAVRQYDIVLFNAGRGAGKSTGGALQAIHESTLYQPGMPGLVIAPTYPMLRDASMKEFFDWLNPAYIRAWHKTDKLLTLTNGSEIAFRSADDPNSLRGPNRAWLWFDEPRNLRTRESFDVVFAQLRVGQCKAWLTTTPAGIFHWIYQLFVEKPLANSTYIVAKTEENPYLPANYAHNLRSQYTGGFAKQELDAQFIATEGAVYDNFSLEHNVTIDAEYNPAWHTFWGCDDGYAEGDGVGSPGHHPRVILMGQQRGDGGLNIFDEYYQTLRLPEQSIEEVLQRGYHKPRLAMVDSSAAEFRRRLGDRGIMNGGATHPVADGIKVVRRFICDGHGVRLLKIHPRCANLIRELQAYRYDDKSSAVYAGEPKPLKLDDHAADALRYLLWNFR